MMISSMLTIVTFLAGATWGPLVTLHKTENAKACAIQMRSIAESIKETAKTNISGGAEVLDDSEKVLIVVAGMSKRTIAHISCI